MSKNKLDDGFDPEMSVGAETRAMLGDGADELLGDEKGGAPKEPEPTTTPAVPLPVTPTDPPTDPPATPAAGEPPVVPDPILTEHGLEGRFKTPTELARAYTEMEKRFNVSQQDLSTLRRMQLTAPVAPPQAPPVAPVQPAPAAPAPIDRAKFLEQLEDDPVTALTSVMGQMGFATQAQVEAVQAQYAQQHAHEEQRRVDDFIHSTADYEQYRGEITRLYHSMPAMQSMPASQGVPMLYRMAKMSSPTPPTGAPPAGAPPANPPAAPPPGNPANAQTNSGTPAAGGGGGGAKNWGAMTPEQIVKEIGYTERK